MKIYVDVKTPGNGKTYEFMAESAMPVDRTKRRMIEEIIEIEDGNVTICPQKAALYDIDAQAALSGGGSLSDAGVRSGHSLLLL